MKEPNDLPIFDEYLRAGEPERREKAWAWKTAIGLQQVDGLTPSKYLVETAKRNIEGEISLAESAELIADYYKSRPVQTPVAEGEKEADIVSHRYESADVVAATLEYEFERERKFVYQGLSPQDVVAHLTRFVADVWQVHAFGEGNTRTTSIFTIKYLRKLGFDVTNDAFAENARYFRNALVRANYTNLPRGIHPTLVYLERFFANLILGARHELKNRYLHVTVKNPESELVSSPREQVGEQVREQAVCEIKNRPSQYVLKLLKVFVGEMSVLEMMAKLKLWRVESGGWRVEGGEWKVHRMSLRRGDKWEGDR